MSQECLNEFQDPPEVNFFGVGSLFKRDQIISSDLKLDISRIYI